MDSIKDLKPDAQNANKGTPRGLKLLDDSLRKYGAGRSILIDKHGKIIAGNKTAERAVDIGLDDLIIVETDGTKLVAVQRTDLDLETDPQARELAYADNRSSEMGLDWDASQILADLEAGVDLEGMFTDIELEDFGWEPDKAEDPGVDMNRADELQEKWQVQRGQIFEIPSLSVEGKCHKIMCGDSTDAGDVAKLMGGEKAGAVVTDPPYGINREGIENDDPEGLRELFDRCLGVMPIDNAVVIAFQSPRLFPAWLDAVRDAGHKFERMLWMYKPNDETFPWRGWLLKSEAILISSFQVGQWRDVHPYHDDYYECLWGGMEVPNGTHASVKPLAVVTDLLSRVGGETIYDPFLGSGTTCVAAEQTGRVCYGCEISPAHTSVCLERLQGMGLSPRLVTDHA